MEAEADPEYNNMFCFKMMICHLPLLTLKYFSPKILTFDSFGHWELHLTTFLALPSLSILQSPAHSPSFMLLSTCVNQEFWLAVTRQNMDFFFVTYLKDMDTHLDQGDAMLLAEGGNELLILRRVTVLSSGLRKAPAGSGTSTPCPWRWWLARRGWSWSFCPPPWSSLLWTQGADSPLRILGVSQICQIEFV